MLKFNFLRYEYCIKILWELEHFLTYIESAIVHVENSSISSLWIASSQKNSCQQFPKRKNPYVEAYQLSR